MTFKVLSVLGAVLLSSLLGESVHACSVHDHNCQFHSIGRAVNPNVDPNAPTAVYIVTEASNGIDFDNNVLLPDHFGPYIASGTTSVYDPNQPYLGVSDFPRHVSPTQPQMEFNGNTAQAIHSGDFNGGLAASGGPGCQYSVASNCEEVKIFGNLPDPQDGVGFVVRQTNYLYNFHNVPDPSVELQSYAVATGSAFIRTFGHQTVYDEQTITPYSYDSLNEANPTGSEKTYYIGFYGFKPHAQGLEVAIPENWTTYGSQYSTQVGDSIYTYQDVTLHSQQKLISYKGDVSFEGYSRTGYTNLLGVTKLAPPAPVVTAFDTPGNVNTISSSSGRIPDSKSKDIYWIVNPDTGKSYPLLESGASVASKIRYGLLVTGGTLSYVQNKPVVLVDGLQKGFDNASYIPLAGDVVDGANALVSLSRAGFSYYQGDTGATTAHLESAGQSAIGLIPIPGVSGGAVKTTNNLVTPAGKTYLDPLSNKIITAPDYVKMENDHIFPQKEIGGLDGYKELTSKQQKELLTYPGNYQNLPKSLNCSKGCKLQDSDAPWVKAGDQLINPDYSDLLKEKQKELKLYFETKIYEMLE